jgi:hypothetical protein
MTGLRFGLAADSLQALGDGLPVHGGVVHERLHSGQSSGPEVRERRLKNIRQSCAGGITILGFVAAMKPIAS